MSVLCMNDLNVLLLESLKPGECDGTFRMVDTWCRIHGLDEEFVKEKAGGRAGCDCELILNVFLAEDRNQFLPPGTIIPAKSQEAPELDPEESVSKEV